MTDLPNRLRQVWSFERLQSRVDELEELIATLSSEHGDMNEANVRYEKRIADLESELEEWKDSCDPGVWRDMSEPITNKELLK